MPITPVSDKTITRQVQGRIANRGLRAPCRIAVETLKGVVTLTGSVAQSQQKVAAVQAVQGVSGVRQIIDRLSIKTVAKY